MEEKKGFFSSVSNLAKSTVDGVVSATSNIANDVAGKVEQAANATVKSTVDFFHRSEKDNSDEKTGVGISAPVVANALEQGQYSKFHTSGGHGFAAEDANAFADRLRGKRVETVGRSNVLNGADRIADGVAIQTKYCVSPGATVRAAFDSKTGLFRYSNQLLEVPKDQYQSCVDLMRQKIAEGKVPGVANPADAEKIVKAGEITYRQARNVARAGTCDSLIYDAKSGAITSSYVFGISYLVVFAVRVWRGESPKEAARAALKSSGIAAATVLTTGIATAQVLRTRVAACGAVAVRSATKRIARTSLGKWSVEKVARASLGKAVYGSAAANHVSKLVRTNAVAGTVTTLILSGPDAYRAAIKKSISWRQFAKNFGVNVASTVGGAGGWFAGAAVGTAVAGPVGGIVGGLAGAMGGGAFAQKGAKAFADKIAEDDRALLLETTEEILAKTASDFMFSDDELEEATRRLQALATSDWTKALWNESEENRRTRIETDVDVVCLEVATNRGALKDEISVENSMLASV